MKMKKTQAIILHVVYRLYMFFLCSINASQVDDEMASLMIMSRICKLNYLEWSSRLTFLLSIESLFASLLSHEHTHTHFHTLARALT